MAIDYASLRLENSPEEELRIKGEAYGGFSSLFELTAFRSSDSLLLWVQKGEKKRLWKTAEHSPQTFPQLPKPKEVARSARFISFLRDTYLAVFLSVAA
ncbi:MAG: hypothetical protein J0M12_09440 [Deltaproteobacteria bacterium]|nr:hypothetical protein [Deltaproteobacteria bacterium]